MIDYTKFQRSLEHLELQYKNHKGLEPSQPELIKEAVVESVIQRFETCYDCLWKTLKRYLKEESGFADVPNSPKPLIRMAGENDLLPSPVEQWIAYVNARIDTAHDYNAAKATECLELMEEFIPDAIRLYEQLTGEPWK